ncbi:RICIN domain-containing protein [Streptomyces sp. XY332]|uniref:RICIN domain-containing protein n=1 Tax=Streptomyces sp. XY332 TaxID=1415561 RepID=UPI00099B817D|nr:RICIN domain-containing protein [Streptomyces sp. XY332]
MRTTTRHGTGGLATPVATLSLVAAGLFAPSTADAQEQYYYIVNNSTNMVAAVASSSLDEGAWVTLWPQEGSENQQFSKIDASGNWFLLRAKHSGKCLSRTRDNSSRAIIQTDCRPPTVPGGPRSDVRQLWRVREVRKTPAECPDRNQCFAAYRTVLDNWYNSDCLDAANAKAPIPPVQGTALQAWECINKFSDWNAVNQDWDVVKTQDW